MCNFNKLTPSNSLLYVLIYFFKIYFLNKVGILYPRMFERKNWKRRTSRAQIQCAAKSKHRKAFEN